MSTRPQPSAAIIASGVVAIVGSVLSAIGVSLGVMGLFLTSHLQVQPQVPSGIRNVAIGTMFVLLAITIFGIFTGVGLLRLKDWARISVLVWSGIAVFISAMVVLFAFFIRFPTPPNASAGESTGIRAFLIVFYGLPFAIGVWWLLLFSRKTIASQFLARALANGAIVGDQFSAVAPRKPRAPIPVMILAILYLVAPLSLIWMIYVRPPTILFGHIFRGPTAMAISVLSCVLCLAMGIGLVTLRRWSYSLAIGCQIFWPLSGVISMLTPGYDAFMREMMTEISERMGGTNSPYMTEHLRGSMLFGLVFAVAILGILFYYRPAFLRAAALAEKRSS